MRLYYAVEKMKIHYVEVYSSSRHGEIRVDAQVAQERLFDDLSSFSSKTTIDVQESSEIAHKLI